MSWYDYVFEDPFESWERCQEDDSYDNGGFVKDPLYYHTYVEYYEIELETRLAIHLDTKYGRFWCPKSLVREHDKEAQTMYIHTKFLNDKIKEIEESEDV